MYRAYSFPKSCLSLSGQIEIQPYNILRGDVTMPLSVFSLKTSPLFRCANNFF